MTKYSHIPLECEVVSCQVQATSFVLQRMFESLQLVTYSNSGKLSQSSDVNTEEKKSFILSTMLRSFERVTPSTLSETRLLDPLRIDFTKLQNDLGLLLVKTPTSHINLLKYGFLNKSFYNS